VVEYIQYLCRSANPVYWQRLVEETDETGRAIVAIDPQKYDKLITALRTAISIENSLQKEQTSCHDILDAFRMCCHTSKGEVNNSYEL
jgi:hypothetical protein